MHDILMPLIDWDRCPARHIGAASPIIAPGEPTSVLFLLHAGQTRSADGSTQSAGHILSLCEALALDSYRSAVHAVSDCELRVIQTENLEAAIRAVSSSPQASQPAFQSWLEQARQRANLESSLEDLRLKMIAEAQ